MELIKSLKEIINEYEYVDQELLDRKLTIIYNYDIGEIDIKLGKTSEEKIKKNNSKNTIRKGTCGELTKLLLKDLKKEGYDKENYITILNGKDPDYFTSEGSSHIFIALTNKDEKVSYTENIIKTIENISGDSIQYIRLKNREINSQIKKLEKKNPLIIDPSFNKVEYFNNSKYKINNIILDKHTPGHKNNIYLSEKRTIPLYKLNNNIIYLGSNFTYPDAVQKFKHPEKLFIGIQEPGENIFTLDLNSREGKSIEYKLAHEFVEKLNSATKIHIEKQKEKEISTNKFYNAMNKYGRLVTEKLNRTFTFE